MNAQPFDPAQRRRAFVARRFTDRVEAAIAARFAVVRPQNDRPVAPADLVEAAQGCTHIFVSVTDPLPGWCIDQLAPTLRVIASLSVGHDHIDLAAAQRHGVSVLLTPDVLSAACAELAMMLMLGAARRGHEADAMVRSGQWPGWAPTQLLGKGLVGRRLGILGLGRIGREVAARARGFGMTIHYHNRRPAPDTDACYHESAESLLAVSDVLCLCAPGGSGLAPFLNARRLALLPRGAVVVNIARGDLIDDTALIAALQSGQVFAAGLDVFAGEPEVDPRYASLPNVVLSPHIGSATEETRDAMGFLLIDGIDALDRHERPINQLC
ncbi:2-hydroxyacid dehydrogenase [Novosphingobium sp.]|uniref:2-hydroxyacid dehydrogenase n=1 Tax=Novosphingobium sp. TaxID=1874826 RepID=UPI003BAAF812